MVAGAGKSEWHQRTNKWLVLQINNELRVVDVDEKICKILVIYILKYIGRKLFLISLLSVIYLTFPTLNFIILN